MQQSGFPPIVMHVAPVDGKRASGMTHSVPATVKALHDLGVPTGLLTTSPLGPYRTPQPYPVVYLRDVPWRSALASMPEPLNRPDLVVFSSTYIPAQAWMARSLWQKGIPYIITPRGGMTRGAQHLKWLKKWAGNVLFFRAMVRRAVAIHCLTEREAMDVRRWGRPVFVVGNGVDLPSPQHLARPGQRGELQFVFVGRLAIGIKGLDLLIEACTLVREALLRAGARVYLYGPDVRGSRGRIEQMISTGHLEGLVRVCDPVYGAEKARVLQSADVFVHTSRFEGHPMSVLEALSYGLPCLLTSGTNLSSVVSEAGAGWEAETTAWSIASALLEILQAGPDVANRGIAARALARERYSWNQVGRQLLENYSRLIGQ